MTQTADGLHLAGNSQSHYKHPPAWKPYGLEANILLLGDFLVPLDLYFRNLRCRRILAHDPLRGIGSPLRAGGHIQFFAL